MSARTLRVGDKYGHIRITGVGEFYVRPSGRRESTSNGWCEGPCGGTEVRNIQNSELRLGKTRSCGCDKKNIVRGEAAVTRFIESKYSERAARTRALKFGINTIKSPDEQLYWEFAFFNECYDLLLFAQVKRCGGRIKPGGASPVCCTSAPKYRNKNLHFFIIHLDSPDQEKFYIIPAREMLHRGDTFSLTTYWDKYIDAWHLVEEEFQRHAKLTEQLANPTDSSPGSTSLVLEEKGGPSPGGLGPSKSEGPIKRRRSQKRRISVGVA
jgi:hypothetical protein